MRVGLIARSDCGGLAAQSIEFARNLPIAATLVVNLGDKGRGPTFPFAWPNVSYVRGPNIDDLETVSAFLDQVDVVLSIETFYGYQVIELANKRGIPTVRYANPELYKDEGQSHVVLPTEWERDRIPDAGVIPQGVTVHGDKENYVKKHKARTLLHFASPAMLDRNGTYDVHAALSHTKNPFHVHIVGPKSKEWHRDSKHYWYSHEEYSRDRLSWYRAEIDLLVLPRKYGGLSLPMLEAASFGIPTITTDLSPQNKWFGADNLIPVGHTDRIDMVGGKIPVSSVNIPALTWRLDRYWNESIEQLSRRALAFADKFAWAQVSPLWMEYFSSILP